MFNLETTAVEGCVVLRPKVLGDSRGRFVKTLHADFFAAQGLESNFVEQYYTVSAPGVLRGLHLQFPPHDHAKLVYCVQGSVLDVLLDLRVGSPTYGRYATVELDSEGAAIIYIARGIAHGFCVPSVESILVYNVTSVYAPEFDGGIRWDSAGIDWPISDPILSARDKVLPPLSAFRSPFSYRGGVTPPAAR